METWNGFRVVGAVEDDTDTDNDFTKDGELVPTLKKMLAEAYVLYHTIHGFHWNVEGSDFYEYHKLFDEIVSDIYENIDPIAESIKKLGEKAPFSMSQLVSISSIKDTDLESNNTKELSKKFLGMNEEYIDHIKKAFRVANDADEQGIANFIAERIDQHQKWSWFLKASTEA